MDLIKEEKFEPDHVMQNIELLDYQAFNRLHYMEVTNRLKEPHYLAFYCYLFALAH